MPERVQLRRSKGWRKPEGALVVARPSRWGNPVPWSGGWITWTAVGLGYRADAAGRRAAAVAIYRSWITQAPVALGPESSSDVGGSIEFADGSSFTIAEHTMGIARVAARLVDAPPTMPDRPSLAEIVSELGGRDLACWCSLDNPCHADVLLELANESGAASNTSARIGLNLAVGFDGRGVGAERSHRAEPRSAARSRCRSDDVEA